MKVFNSVSKAVAENLKMILSSWGRTVRFCLVLFMLVVSAYAAKIVIGILK